MLSTETKGMLAKCLATENLIIEDSYDASMLHLIHRIVC